MRIKAHNGFGQPIVIPVTSIVVEDDAGNVLFAAQQSGPRQIDYTHTDDPDYHRMLKVLGIRKSLIIEDIQTKPLENVIWTP